MLRPEPRRGGLVFVRCGCRGKVLAWFNPPRSRRDDPPYLAIDAGHESCIWSAQPWEPLPAPARPLGQLWPRDPWAPVRELKAGKSIQLELGEAV